MDGLKPIPLSGGEHPFAPCFDVYHSYLLLVLPLFFVIRPDFDPGPLDSNAASTTVDAVKAQGAIPLRNYLQLV